MHIGTISATSLDLLYDSSLVEYTLSEFASRLQQIYSTIVLPHDIATGCFGEALTCDRSLLDLKAFTAIFSGKYSAEEINLERSETFTDESLTGVKEVLRQLRGHLDRIIFTTKDGHLGALYHPDPLTSVQLGDVVVGLFGMNYPFVLHPLPRKAGGEQTYAMVNIAYLADHTYGHDFVSSSTNSEPGTKWEEFERFGLREYTIL